MVSLSPCKGRLISFHDDDDDDDDDNDDDVEKKSVTLITLTRYSCLQTILSLHILTCIFVFRAYSLACWFMVQSLTTSFPVLLYRYLKDLM